MSMYTLTTEWRSETGETNWLFNGRGKEKKGVWLDKRIQRERRVTDENVAKSREFKNQTVYHQYTPL